jgi:hypothetical protein
MFELLTALEDTMVLSFYVDSDGDYHVTQFAQSAELDAFLATADAYEEDECGMYFLFGSVWVSVHEDMGEDE